MLRDEPEARPGGTGKVKKQKDKKMKIIDLKEAETRLAEIVKYIEDKQNCCLDDEPVLTSETFGDWDNSSKSWNECGDRSEGIVGDIPFIQFDDVQVAKGQTRHTITVYDLGGCRLVDKA